MNIIKDQLTTLHRFQIMLISVFKESKSSFITSAASSFIITSVLSLFECIARSSSLSMELLKKYSYFLSLVEFSTCQIF